MPQTVSLTFLRFSGPFARAWAFGMMGAGRFPLERTPDIGFWKLCGSGQGEGFTPILFPKNFAILAVWPNEDIARERVATAPIFHRYRKRATEDWSVFLQATSSRGAWSGVSPFDATPASRTGPIAALTRATVRPHQIARFWKRTPSISDVIGADANVIFKIGIGEVPLMQQVTFSIWPSVEAMAGFARTGPHAEAIKAVRTEGWFEEELYARFQIVSDMGTWGGASPLETSEAA